jgi:hyperosmotically inducible periplasmic protein
MRRLFIVVLSLMIAASAAAAQTADTAAPKKAKPAAVDCSKTDDAAISASVKDKLAKTPSLKDFSIGVRTKEGVVTLTGTVKAGRNKGLASLQAKRVQCVKKVDNQITVEQSQPAPKKQG